MGLPANRTEEQHSSQRESRHLRAIVRALKMQKCVLILGNYAFSKIIKNGDISEEITVPDLIQKEIESTFTENKKNIPNSFYAKLHSLIQEEEGSKEIYFEDLAEIGYEELTFNQIERFKKLSEIPFDLIISIYPFDILSDVFRNNRIQHDFSYYNYKIKLEEPEEPSIEKPLIYQLFGSVESMDSVIFDLDRLSRFISAAQGANPLPKLIQDKIEKASHIIFLGFDFDDWYMKPLMLLLNLHLNDKFPYAHPPKYPNMNGRGSNDQWLFDKYFNLTFFDRQIDTFIEIYIQNVQIRKS